MPRKLFQAEQRLIDDLTEYKNKLERILSSVNGGALEHGFASILTELYYVMENLDKTIVNTEDAINWGLSEWDENAIHDYYEDYENEKTSTGMTLTQQMKQAITDLEDYEIVRRYIDGMGELNIDEIKLDFSLAESATIDEIYDAWGEATKF